MLAIMVVPHLILPGRPGQAVTSKSHRPRIPLFFVIVTVDLLVAFILVVVDWHPLADGRNLGDERGFARTQTVDSDPIFAGMVGGGCPGYPDRLTDMVSRDLGRGRGCAMDVVTGSIVCR